MALKNRFAEAYNNSSHNVNRPNGPKKNDIVIDGSNYGLNWGDEDQIRYDLYLKSLEFDNNVDMIDYINEYNSPASQVARLRDAGLNPNLQSIDGGTAQGQTTSAPSAPDGVSNLERTQQISSLSQQFFELIPQAISLYQSIQGGFQQLDLNQLELLNARDSIAQHEIGKQLNVDDLNRPDVIPTLSYSHLPRRQQRHIERQVSSYLDDFHSRNFAKNFVYRARAGAETSRQDYLNLLGKYGFDVNDDAFVKVLKSFNEVISDSTKARSNYDKDYFSTKSGTIHANTENKEVEKRGKVADNDVYAELMSKANKLIDSNDKSDKIGGYIMYIMLGLMNNVSYSRTSGPKGSSSTIAF